MDATLIATKLRAPARREPAVRRARLVEALEHAVAHYRLVLVSAPAGYGKTTLLVDWAHASRFPVAWLSLDEDDSDLERFLRYLVGAWVTLRPEVADSPVGLLASARGLQRDAVLTAFLNLADEVNEQLVFVLDDFHLIADPAIHEALTYLIDHLPPNLHFVLAGRETPPLPLARYRARAQLSEIRADELAFSPEETGEFLGRVMGLDLTSDEQASLQGELEGWIAGLQLAALTLRHRGPDAADLTIGGRHGFIADYLNQDVLAGLTPENRQFLLQTSILDRLCGALCDAVTAGAGGQETLALLERENLFVVPLDDRREWFRYHQLFAEVLREELTRRYGDDVAELHARASRWYLDHDMPELAFSHALVAHNARLVVGVLDRYGNAKLLAGELNLLRRWLDSIPPEWYEDFPVLGLAEAGYFAYTGAFEETMRWVDEVEQQLRRAETEDTRWQRARLTAVRCMMACVQYDVPQAEAYAQKGLQELPEDDLGYRPGIFAALGDTYRNTGRWAEAKECYLKALSSAHAPPVLVEAPHLHGALADLDLLQGHLTEAAAHWRQALQAVEDQASWGRRSLPVMGWIHIRLGEIQYEWDDRAGAWESVARGLERAELGGDVRALIAGYILAGRLELAAGSEEVAEGYLSQARPLVEQAQFPEWTSRFERLQLDLWLAQGRLRTALAWIDEMRRSGVLEERPDSETVQLAAARVLLFRGDAPSVERALPQLKRLQSAAEAEGRTAILIEALTLQAVSEWQRGDRAGALVSLERALRLAQPEGYIRLFADLGLPLARLLQEAHARSVLPDYVARVLSALGSGLSWAPAEQGALLEPLSPRELEIISLIAAGLTNREVADKLVISPETVKKHTSAIYGKLGALNRTQAVARARELNLLD